jgi:DNA polymerase (family 10)
MTNLEVAELLRSVAASYEIKDADKNKFKIIAYNKAADAIEHLTSEIKDIYDEGKLDDIPGVGPSISAHLHDIFSKGDSKHFKAILAGMPTAMFKLMEVPGIGAKTAYKLSEQFNIPENSAINKLKWLATKGKIARLLGFGEDSQNSILKSIGEFEGRKFRMLLPYAKSIASEIVEWMKTDPNTKRCDPLGSLRRGTATVGDIDIAAGTVDSKATLTHFTKFPKATRIFEQGEHAAGIIIGSNIHIDLMTVEPDSYGSLLQHFTGSKHHNIALREYALKRGLSLSEYGIRNLKSNKLNKTETEENFYENLGLLFIPPELREDNGEIEAFDKSNKSAVPKLVELDDIKADLQIHSNFDIETSHDLGDSSMEEIVDKAQTLEYEYFALTEHNPSRSRHNDEEILDLLLRKKDSIEQLNYSLKKSVNNRVQNVFNSLEIDILPNGELAVPEKALETLDFALVSIHSSFKMAKVESTKRILNALSHPNVKIFAHPTGRKINFRESVDADWSQIFEYCAKNNKYLEINADPMRLDLPDFMIKEAKSVGCKFTLGTDAHHTTGMDNMRWGVICARRGWLEASDILNTLQIEDFKKMLK